MAANEGEAAVAGEFDEIAERHLAFDMAAAGGRHVAGLRQPDTGQQLPGIAFGCAAGGELAAFG